MKTFYTSLLLILLFISLIFRLFRLGIPQAYIFDEVYHVPSIRAISQNNPDVYDPFAKSPEPDTAYDWLHPPLAKLIQAASIKLIGDNSFAWRFPSAIFGLLSILTLYYFALTLFNNKPLALLASLFFSLDGLQLTMSRITMNDIFVIVWIILALNFFYRYLYTKDSPGSRFLILTGIFTGLALATKWSSLLLYPIFAIFLLPQILSKPKKIPTLFCSLFFLPLVIYLLSYSQFFLQNHSLKDFYNLHQQIFWYQTNLTATHSYQSSAWQWPLLIRPVWFYVKYYSNTIANIYNLGNPAIFWGGLTAAAYLIIKKRYTLNAARYCLITFLFLWLPWLFSPRIMFLHHYLPALPFLCLLLAKALSLVKNKLLITSYLLLVTGMFLFFYPLNTATPLPTKLLQYWFWLPTWK